MTELKTSDFDYYLPNELIAQFPLPKREKSRLMVLNRKNETIEHRLFEDIIEYLDANDLLVLNNTKVVPLNLIGRKENGSAKIEVLLVKKNNTRSLQKEKKWICLVKPGKRLKIGSYILFSDYLKGRVVDKLDSGEQIIEFRGDLQRFILEKGKLPFPPYINIPKNFLSKTEEKFFYERYQTVYAKKEGAAASPTAGLHFTDKLLDKIKNKVDKIKNKGIAVEYITLHTGLGTFKPVYVEYIKDHKMFNESFEVPRHVLSAIKNAKRVIAVGTTTVRALETLKNRDLLNSKSDIKGETDIFIYPGVKFSVVDMMVTNFHIPKSTLLMLVSAFAGKEFIFRAYKEAVDKEYRFFSFGDAMLIV